MKITGMKIMEHTAPYVPEFPHEDRQVGQLDFYDEYRQGTWRAARRGSEGGKEPGTLTQAFLVIETDEGFEGVHGPIDYRTQLLAIFDGLSGHVIGRDPLENRMIWDIMSRYERHARTGVMMMAISAVDNALWDLKGKILGQPVYKLLGGGRDRLRPYMSMLGFSIDPKRAAERAQWIKGKGIQAQKWFFRYGPGDGMEGMRKNLDMAVAVREAVGKDYDLMFDCWMGWDTAYAKMLFQELRDVRPLWVEEVLRPQMQDGYDILKAQTDVPLASGEHLYTRMEVNYYMKNGIFDVMQSDPEWCGGITETLRIADLCEMYGARLVPHGHALWPAMHVVAASSPQVCPYVEYLYMHIPNKTCMFKVKPLTEDGWLLMNKTPGIGADLDFEKITKSRQVTEFTL